MTSPTKILNFRSAVKVVKDDYKCVVCLELCDDPVTLSKCFHLICFRHFEGLKTCPKCGASLEDCTIFRDEHLQECVISAKLLDEMLDTFLSKENVPISLESPTLNLTEGSSKDVNRRRKNTRNSLVDLNSSKASNASTNARGIEKRNNKGETALHIACRLGKIDRITELLTQGANTNTKDNAGWTPLHEVVQNGRLDLVQLLLQHNCLVNVPGQGNETPLHEAVRYDHIEIAAELVKYGADINARNVKGETPFELAKDNMKDVLENAAGNIVQTQTENIVHISEQDSEVFEDIRIYCVSSDRIITNKLKSLCKSHNNMNIETKLTKRVTHLIVDEENGVCRSSLDVLQGIVYGVWILSSDWVIKSTDDKLEPFKSYEVTGVGTKTYNGPRISRFNKYKQLPGIFNGCHFYLHNFNTKYEISKSIILTKASLTKLITDAGGIVLRRVPNPELIPEAERLVPYHAKKGGKLTKCSHYIIFKDIYEPMYNMEHLKALPIGWLIECLEKYELCEPWLVQC